MVIKLLMGINDKDTRAFISHSSSELNLHYQVDAASNEDNFLGRINRGYTHFITDANFNGLYNVGIAPDLPYPGIRIYDALRQRLDSKTATLIVLASDKTITEVKKSGAPVILKRDFDSIRLKQFIESYSPK